jgi:hypothetical protein
MMEFTLNTSIQKVLKTILKIALISISIISLCACNAPEKRVSHYANGQIETEVYFIDGVQHGKQLDYYPSGKIQGEASFERGKLEGKAITYHENGKLRSIVNYSGGVATDTAKYFYEDGMLESVVPYRNGLKNGWVLFYDKQGKLSDKHEYFSYGSKEHQNQWIRYDEHGKIINQNSFYISTNSESDSIMLGEQYRLIVKLETPDLGEDSQMEVHIGNFDHEYRLKPNSIPDTVTSADFKSSVIIKPSKRGKHRVRGRVVNYIVKDSIMRETHIYFTKNYYVL